MWTPKKIVLKNFMSHESTEFEFVNKRAVMVFGENLTDKGQKSNGSGKSALIEAISLLLIGTPLRNDVSTKELVREGEGSFEILIELINADQELSISRTVFSNTKSSELMIKMNGKIPKALVVNSDKKVDVRDGEKFIISTLGISKDDLRNYFIISLSLIHI